jgi:hypothetical protein
MVIRASLAQRRDAFSARLAPKENRYSQIAAMVPVSASSTCVLSRVA